MRQHLSLLLVAVAAAALITGVHFDYLFAPDEPRVAEIARETLREGRWVTPHLCGLPFLEKPPLYYNVVALAYALTGRITATVARSVSLLFGCLMLVPVFAFGNRWRGSRTAWFFVFILMTMPRFWRYSHMIVIDIAVGAFCTCALTCFAFASFWETAEGRKRLLTWLFALFSAGAFFTKGIPGVFTIVIVVGAFCLLEKRWSDLRRIFSPIPLLLFLIPAAAWLFLYYREGGIAYLHEHFINNIFGRLLQIQFQLPDSRFYHTDVGYQLPWYFYLATLPEILGLWVALLPFAVWRVIGEMRKPSAPQNRSLLSFVLLWAFLPSFLLSFSSIKERTYIFPSYAGMAIILGFWLDSTLAEREKTIWKGVGWLCIVFPFSLLSLLSHRLDFPLFITVAACMISPAAISLIVLFAKRRFTEASFLTLSIMLCVLMIIFSPRALFARWESRCHMALSREAWSMVGPHPLYLYVPRDSIRGAIPFYGDRTTPEIDRPPELRELLEGEARVYVLIENYHYEKFAADPSFDGILFKIPSPGFELEPDNRLYSNMRDE